MILPDRAQVTMTVPFMRAYTELLVQTCHRRGAHAIGGMAAFIPNRREPEVNERALAAVREDKERESGDGFDGTWVAHPDLVPVAARGLRPRPGRPPHQKDRLRPEVARHGRATCSTSRVDGRAGHRGRRAREHLGRARSTSPPGSRGNGAAAINNLMEDAATAEISRSQLWQWRVHAIPLDDGQPVDRGALRRAPRRGAGTGCAHGAPDAPWTDAAALLDELVLSDDFVEFLTLPAYPGLVRRSDGAQAG